MPLAQCGKAAVRAWPCQIAHAHRCNAKGHIPCTAHQGRVERRGFHVHQAARLQEDTVKAGGVAGEAPLLAWATYASIAWWLVSWWSHDNFHRVQRIQAQIFREFRFRSDLVLIYFFKILDHLYNTFGNVCGVQK